MGGVCPQPNPSLTGSWELPKSEEKMDVGYLPGAAASGIDVQC